MNALNQRILILNADYTAIAITDVKKAYTLIFQEKVDVLEWKDGMYIHSVNAKHPVPSIIRLKKWININKIEIPLNRRNLEIRDGFTCVYCGSKEDLTIDHIMPKSRGGKDTWDNLTTACLPCNTKKDNKTPQEAGMKVPRTYRPTYLKWFSLVGSKLYADGNNGWDKYLFLS